MQREVGDLPQIAPADLLALPVGRARAHRGDLSGDDGRVAPPAVIDGGQPGGLDRSGLDGRFLRGFAQGRRDDVLVAVPGPAGQAPGAALMRTWRPMLENDPPGRGQQQPGGTVAAPVAMAEVAGDPPVTVTVHAPDPPPAQNVVTPTRQVASRR